MLIVDYNVDKISETDLPPCYEELLCKLFDDERLVSVRIEDRLIGGYSGVNLYQVRPVAINERGKRLEQLNQVVKLGSINLINQERDAYKEHIKGMLPLVVPIIEHCESNDGMWGGLRYQLVGDGVFEFCDLLEYCQVEESATDIANHILDSQILKAIKRLHECSDTESLTVGRSYDKVLPPNLTVRYIEVVKSKISWGGSELTKDSYSGFKDENLEDTILLHSFVVTEINHQKQSVTVNLSPQESINIPANSFRIRIESIEDLQPFHIGQEMPIVVGKIVQTRMRKLEEEMSGALGRQVSFKDEEILFENDVQLNNPLRRIEYLLGFQIRLAVVGEIHGDLNLHNILVAIQSNTLNFIDVANARYDHVLHDYLKLETEIVTKLVAHIMKSSEEEMPIKHFIQFYEMLHVICVEEQEDMSHDKEQLISSTLALPFHMLMIIRLKAKKREYIKDWNEYYICLTLYMLGALKFDNLNEKDSPSLPKKLATIAAAILVSQIKENPPSEEDEPIPIPRTVFNEQYELMQKVPGIKTIDGVTVICLTSGTKIGVDFLSAGVGRISNPSAVTISSKNQLQLSGWPESSKPAHIAITRSQSLKGWPNGNHDWESRMIMQGEEFLYPGKDGVFDIESFDPSIIDAVLWITHKVTREGEDVGEEKFLILVKS